MSKPSAAAAKSVAPFALGHFVAGRHVAGTSGREGPVFNPATGEAIKIKASTKVALATMTA